MASFTVLKPCATQPPPGTWIVAAELPEGVNVHVPAMDVTISPVATTAGQTCVPPSPPSSLLPPSPPSSPLPPSPPLPPLVPESPAGDPLDVPPEELREPPEEPLDAPDEAPLDAPLEAVPDEFPDEPLVIPLDDPPEAPPDETPLEVLPEDPALEPPPDEELPPPLDCEPLAEPSTLASTAEFEEESPHATVNPKALTRAAARTRRSIVPIVFIIARKLRYLSCELVTGDVVFCANSAHERRGIRPPFAGCEIQVKWRPDSRKR